MAVELKPDAQKYRNHLADLYASRGDRRKKKKDFAGALADHTTAIAVRPSYAYGYSRRGHVYASMNDFASAVKDYTKAIELDPKKGSAVMFRASAHLKAKNWDAASSDYTRSMVLTKKEDAFHHVALLDRAFCKRRKGDFAGAIADAKSANALRPFDLRGWFTIGKAQQDKGDYEAAISTYGDLLALEKSGKDYRDLKWAIPAALMNRARARLARRDVRGANRDLRAVEARKCTDTVVLMNIGDTYLRIRRRGHAERNFARAVQRNRRSTRALVGLADSRRRQGQPIPNEIKIALALDPNYSDAYRARGEYHAGRKRHDLAYADFCRALELDPNNVKALASRGFLSADLGQTKLARADLVRALALDKTRMWVRTKLVKIHENAKNYDAALKVLDSSPAIRHSRRELRSRGRVRHASGNHKGAVEDFTAALELGSSNWSDLTERAEAKYALKDFEGAVADCDAALKLFKCHKTHHVRGLALLGMGNTDEAGRALTAATKLANTSKQLYDSGRVLGFLHSRRGGLAGAIKAFTHVLRYEKRDSSVWAGRGYALDDSGQWTRALADFVRSLEVNAKSTQYSRYRIFLLRCRLGERADAITELRARWTARKAKTRSSWEARLEAFMIGEITEDALLAGAKAGTAKRTNEQKCEAYYYTGMLRLLGGDRDGAVKRFQSCIRTGVNNFTEYRSAIVELARVLTGMQVQRGPNGRGILLTRAVAHGPAGKAGLADGDVILDLAGAKAFEQLADRLVRVGKGDRLSSRFERNDKVATTTIEAQ